MIITNSKRMIIFILVAALALIGAVTGNLRYSQIRSGDRQGNGSKILMAGTIGGSTGDTLCKDANGNATTSGCTAGTGSGSVTSVAQTVPSGFSVSGSPVTTSGTLAITYAGSQTANRYLATPDGSTGALSLRAIAGGDLPTPTTSVFGGIKDIAAVTSKWITSIVNGVPILAQPAETDLSLSDETTQNATTGRHGFLKKLSGTSTDCARGDGTWASCTVSSGSGASGLTLVEQHTASTSTSLDFTTCITSTYDDYEIHFINVVPATNNVSTFIRLSTDGGSTYDSSNIYYHGRLFEGVTSGGSGGIQSGGISGLLFGGNDNGNGANYGLNGVAHLFDPRNSSLYKLYTYSAIGINNVPVLYLANGAGVYQSTTTVNAFRVIMSSGNITSGTVRCYGVAK